MKSLMYHEINLYYLLLTLMKHPHLKCDKMELIMKGD